MKLYSEEYKEKRTIAQTLARYYGKEARKNGLSTMDRIRAYLPDELSFRGLRRGFVFAHLGMEAIIECIAHKKAFTVVSGLNPSSPLHLGHKALFDVLIDLQTLGADIQIPLTNDETYIDGKVESIQASRTTAYESIIPDLTTFGFDPERTKLYVITETPIIYRFAMSISRLVTYDMVKAVFGKESLVNVGQIFYRGVVQLAEILLPQLPEFGGPKQTVIPVGIDQHPYVLLARDIAKKLGMIPPSELVVKFQPSLLDPLQKMSGSKPNTAIYLCDSEDEIRKKISRAYTGSVTSLADHQKFGAIPEICPVFQILLNHHPHDTFVEKLRQEYTSGQMTTSELKTITADFIVDVVQKHQEKRTMVAKRDIDNLMLNEYYEARRQ
ncbi:tryptophan--tRNA ligase [Candidatus Gottesmanbacteria bacterium]|nr:tryptophan--tRNA ligase [Candidatus Gottesmanbacteria bacterium]